MSFLTFQSHVATAFILAHSYLVYILIFGIYVYIFSFVFTFLVFSVLLCYLLFSFPFHKHYFSTYTLILVIIWHIFLTVWTKLLDHVRVIPCQCHPYSQILIKFCSNVPSYKKQKCAKLFHLLLYSSWDIKFWNLGNFRAFLSLFKKLWARTFRSTQI